MNQETNKSDLFRAIDALYQARMARLTLGISPASVTCAFYAWRTHLKQSPGKMLELMSLPTNYVPELWKCFFKKNDPSKDDEVQNTPDPRFKSENWDLWPWRLYQQIFTVHQDWWTHATQDVPGLDDQSQRIVSFTLRQALDALCPANFPLTNPDLAFETFDSKGKNLMKGTLNALKDMTHTMAGAPPKKNQPFQVGRNLAVTPGWVVYQNELMELILYSPQTDSVDQEPILITPAWIMKYYVLDLSPSNSLVRWLVEKGHTVFMISWKNPDKDDAHLSLDDYQNRGLMAALDVVAKTCPKSKIHLMGYCLGGTLAMITAATMALDGDKRLKSLSLLAAQGDFRDAGELMVFITSSQISFLKNIMRDQGYLDTKMMAGAFQMLRSYDLIWSKMVNDYLHGLKRADVDLMTWNADATRMPATMHSQYLERLFLRNEFAQGHYTVGEKAVAPENIHLPIFAVGADRDHVAPWQSVYKIHLMINTDITFILTKGGHNSGVISEPGHKGRFFFQHERKQSESYMNPEQWLKKAQRFEGSWWNAWHDWLVEHGSAQKVSPPRPLEVLGAAPGHYIFQK
jgi:polyhydroxyalkanoate synthase subunit PhaC